VIAAGMRKILIYKKIHNILISKEACVILALALNLLENKVF